MQTKPSPRRPRAGSAAILLLILGATLAVAAEPAETGLASVYSGTLEGKVTASGERYDSHALTAAHRALPLGAEVRVTRLDNGKSVRVRINDRGPNVNGRIIDLSSGAAATLGLRTGTARVRLDVLSRSPAPSATGSRP